MNNGVFLASSKIRTSASFGEIIILIVYLPILALTGIEGKMFGLMTMAVSFEPGTKTVVIHANIDKTEETLISVLYVNALEHIGKKTVEAFHNETFIKADGREFNFVLEDVQEEKEGKSYHFQRIEVKSEVSELVYASYTFTRPISR